MFNAIIAQTSAYRRLWRVALNFTRSAKVPSGGQGHVKMIVFLTAHRQSRPAKWFMRRSAAQRAACASVSSCAGTTSLASSGAGAGQLERQQAAGKLLAERQAQLPLLQTAGDLRR